MGAISPGIIAKSIRHRYAVNAASIMYTSARRGSVETGALKERVVRGVEDLSRASSGKLSLLSKLVGS